MRVRAVLFDIGGVLCTTPRTGWQAQWAGRLGLNVEEMIARISSVIAAGNIGAMTGTEVECATARALELDDEQLARFMEDMWSEYLGSLNVELVSYFSDLRPRVRTGIVSNSFVGARERERDAYDFENTCDAIVYSHEVGCMKPDARIYAFASKLIEVDPGETVFIDDRADNVEAARSFGFHAVQFVDNTQAISALNEYLDAPSSDVMGRG